MSYIHQYVCLKYFLIVNCFLLWNILSLNLKKERRKIRRKERKKESNKDRKKERNKERNKERKKEKWKVKKWHARNLILLKVVNLKIRERNLHKFRVEFNKTGWYQLQESRGKIHQWKNSAFLSLTLTLLSKKLC
jgi:Ni/Co efflux regulator RcnB